ncbi:MAG: type II secretion system protein [Nitrospirae bacterium]|uniref:type II secretion system protein n=1 Tax=Candidatus Magnetobacterium casense TaxID=1455061 RepID=UPI00058E2C60|nr:type II secretion system protein [Candidatus Magnetobacterium casensis]MBF0339038.1 type II secretion system protein [Nitrospirota bacterium]
MKLRNQGGLTIIELLIVIFIISMLFSVALPVTLRTYQRYMASLEAEKVLVLMLTVQRESFATGFDSYVRTVDGVMLVNNEKTPIPTAFASLNRPIVFYGNGTTSGGEVIVYVNDFTFVVTVTAPFAGMAMTQG